MMLIECYDVRMHDYLLEIFAINLQPVPDIGDIGEGSDELVFVIRVTIALPADIIRTRSVSWKRLRFHGADFGKDSMLEENRCFYYPLASSSVCEASRFAISLSAIKR